MNNKPSLQDFSLFLLAFNPFSFVPPFSFFRIMIFDLRLENLCGEGGFLMGRWRAQKDGGRLTVIL